MPDGQKSASALKIKAVPNLPSMSRLTENWIFAGLLAAALVVSCLTIERSPTVWIDEVAYSDPGINLAMGNGFKSSAWYSGPKDELWVGNTPLYPLLLAGWVRVFGFDIVPVRLLNFALFALAAGAAWVAVNRLKLFVAPSAKLWLFALLLFGFGPTYIYRNGRPDCLLLLLFALMLLGVSLQSRWLKYGLCALAGFLVPFAGLGGLPYLAMCGFLYLILSGRRGFPEFVVVGVSSALGLVALWATYTSLGMWEGFRASTSSHSTFVSLFHGSGSVMAKLQDLLKNFTGDISLIALAFGVWGAQLLARAIAAQRPPRVVSILSVFILAVPVVMMLVGTFPVYYAWMMYVPAAFAWIFWYDRLLTEKGAWNARTAVICVAMIAILGGLPLRTVLAIRQWEERSYEPVRKLAHATIKPGDAVYCNPQAYYAAKPLAQVAFTGSYVLAMNEKEREQIDVLLVDPIEAETFKSKFGGDWAPMENDVNVSARRNSFGASTYNLEAWRRVRE